MSYSSHKVVRFTALYGNMPIKELQQMAANPTGSEYYRACCALSFMFIDKG